MAEVRDNAERGRFELAVEGDVAVLDYRLAEGVMTLTHTGVPPALEGHGHGATLVKGALDRIRARGLKIVVRCWFIDGYIARHPEYRDLVV